MIKEIWKKDEWITKLRNIDEINIKGKCCFCKYRKMCKGGCHIVALFEKGDIYAPDPRCPHRIDKIKYKKEEGGDSDGRRNLGRGAYFNFARSC